MSDPTESQRDESKVPFEVAAVLGSTLQRLLAEVTFADAWILPDADSPDRLPADDLLVELPVTAPWNGRLLLTGDLATVQDLAAGFHSIPDEMADRSISLDFLAELGSILLRDLFCASDVAVSLRDPRELSAADAAGFWSAASASRVALGCNQGRIHVALCAP
jgi:hypothetical protein